MADLMKDLLRWFTDAWDLFKMEDLLKDLRPQISHQALFQSLWFPIIIISVALWFLYLKRPKVAAVLVGGLGFFYVISVYLPTMSASLTSVANFAIAFVTISAVSIYFIFIRED